MGGEKEEGKEEKNNRRRTDKGRGGKREEGPDTFYSCSNIYLVLQSYNTASSPGSA